MDASIATAIIGLLGAAAVGGLGFILQGLRADIRTNGERIGGLGERIGRLEQGFGRLEERSISEFGQIKDALIRIETAQAEHGRQLGGLAADYGDRIAALERASG